MCAFVIVILRGKHSAIKNKHRRKKWFGIKTNRLLVNRGMELAKLLLEKIVKSIKKVKKKGDEEKGRPV